VTTPPPVSLLIRAPNWVGDAVMLTAILPGVRAALPSARIGILGRPFLKPILAPHADVWLTGDARGGTLGFRDALRAIKSTGPWSTTILCPNSWRSLLEAFMGGARKRVGYARDGRGAFLSVSVPRREPGKSFQPVYMAEYYARLFRAAGIDVQTDGKRPSLPISLADAVGNGDSFRGASVRDYKMRLAPDFIGSGGGLYFSSSFGFGIANAISMSDMLGDHRATFAFSLYQNLAESDFLLAYTYLKRRADFSFGLYQLSSYYDSRVTSVGEFSSYQLFSERNLGVFGQMSLPFNKFYRMDVDLQAYQSSREFYNRRFNRAGIYAPVSRSEVRLLEPSLAFVHDSARYGPFGPVDGTRWRASIARGVAFNDRDISRTTGFVDWRWYNMLFWRNSIALRLTGAASEGADPRVFALGGPTTLRGYDYEEFWGTRMWLASFEYRFPLFDAIIFGWPGRWGFTNIGGTAFFDVGQAFDGTPRNPFNIADGNFRLDDSHADIGVGMYMYVGYFLMSFQFAWPTDVSRLQDDMQFHWYLGPSF
jgi:hypothetical protein